MIRTVVRRMAVAVIIISVVVVASQRRPNQLTIGKAFLVGGLLARTLGWYGF
jgi:hypothetical protein